MLNIPTIGNKIAAARKKINVSQARLAAQLFISPQAVGKWERGESMPDITTLNRLAELLEVDLNYFSENFSPAPLEQMPAVPLINHTPELPSGQQQKKRDWDMSGGNWVDADFSGLNNLHEKFSSSNMQHCRFTGSDLSRLLLKNNNVDKCDCSGANLSNSHIRHSSLTYNLFQRSVLKETELSKNHIKGCDYSGADFSRAIIAENHIEGCNFSGADFTDTTFSSGTLVKSTIEDAVWYRTSFTGMAFDDIIFNGTIRDCSFEHCSFKWLTFRKATMINTFFKNNRFKWIRFRFIDCQADRLTYELLKSSKAEVNGITLLPS